MTEKKQIMIVEDERIVAEDIKTSIQNLGYDVSAVVSSGEEALKKVVENRPNLVLMDIKLKGDMDGVEAASMIRTHTNIPVVYLTAQTDENTLRRAKITEPFGYIVKPFENRNLHIAIEMALYKWRMEKMVKEGEKWFSTTLWSIRDAVITTDRKGLVSFMNHAAEALTGWSFEDAVGEPLKTIFNIFSGKTGELIENPVIKVIQDGSLIGPADETVLISKDGTKRLIEQSSSTIKDDRRSVIGIVLVFHDITKHMQEEKELKRNIEYLKNELRQQTSELIQSEKMSSLGLMVAGVANEINNPLAYVKSNTEFIKGDLIELKERCKQQGMDVEIVEHIKELINKDLQGIDRIATITKTLQTFAKPSGGVKVPSDINQGIDSALLMLRSQINPRDKVIKDYGLLPKIIGNIEQLTQAFMNIILNASQTMDKGEIWIKTWSADGYVNIEIRDNGKGIPDDKLEAIFESPSAAKGNGRGLGLSVCHRIIKEHDGEIVAESEIGKGTKITIKLPMEVQE